MKMNKTLLLKASAFFLLLITLLFSCGIPTYFYVNYTFEKGSGDDSSVSGTFTFTDSYNNLSWVDTGTGPSLMLAYIVTSSPGDIPKFETPFSSTYKRSNNNGIHVSEDELLSYDSGGITYRLHRFSDTTGIDFNSPTYMAYASNPTSADFKVTLSKDSNNFIDLSITDANGSSPPTTPYVLTGTSKLARLNGEAFSTDPSAITGFPDYTVSDTSLTLYCHVFAAVNVSQGLFSNNFWTDLKYLGRITL
ncbi:hypothetical protein SDC9_124781 [bioreactor metagenome]|uniref:Lipoprotein n=1 Tax=bioreactor metagenome TaxID=1076179 RepID=A0A645CLG6_9ZZZZ|nr:hypothetical protein [Sphaerochaeta sp.]